MKKSILLLTDLTNGESEDFILSKYLQKEYDVTISSLGSINSLWKKFHLIIVRDTWPHDEKKFKKYNELTESFRIRAKKKKLKVYNSLDGLGGMCGKNYLLELSRKKYPVIPSIDSIKNINLLPKTKKYLIKPKDGFSSSGIKILTLNELMKLNPKGYIIQPKLEFRYEISFYFVDSKFMYCLIFKPSKIPSWPEPRLYNPTKKELNFARKFVSWNKLTRGIQRIDAIALKDNSLLLLEIEDDSPYFSLTEVNKKLLEKFLGKFGQSIKKYLKEH